MEFHKVNRLRQNIYDDWITRCEETIKAFLAASNIETEMVAGEEWRGLQSETFSSFLSRNIEE